MTIRIPWFWVAFGVLLFSAPPAYFWALVVLGRDDSDVVASFVPLALIFSALALFVLVLGLRLRVQADEGGVTVRNGIWAEHRFGWGEIEDFRVGPGQKGRPVVFLVPHEGELVALWVTQSRSPSVLERYVAELRSWLRAGGGGRGAWRRGVGPASP